MCYIVSYVYSYICVVHLFYIGVVHVIITSSSSSFFSSFCCTAVVQFSCVLSVLPGIVVLGAMVFRDSVESAPCLAFQGLTVPGGGSGSRGPLFWELVTCAYRMVLRFNQHIAAQSQVYNSPCAIVASFQHRESAARPFAARSVSKWLIEDQMARLEKTWRTLTVGLSLSIRP